MGVLGRRLRELLPALLPPLANRQIPGFGVLVLGLYALIPYSLGSRAATSSRTCSKGNWAGSTTPDVIKFWDMVDC